MGLDMYLYCNSRRVCEEVNEGSSDYEWSVPRGIAIYWRKANAIHKWFVDNIQGGNDDCRTYQVSVEDLCRLHDTCKEVLESTRLVDAEIQNGTINGVPNMVQGKKLEDPSKAQELLPVSSGFFFGSQGYNQYYWEDLEHTVEAVAKAIDNLEPADNLGWRVQHKDEPGWFVQFEYGSSW
ncbi:MAG: hypothetical protein IJ586_00100 [Alloprevotella sp.]|nr:hypothetical protein [Alloprevotella sp.]